MYWMEIKGDEYAYSAAKNGRMIVLNEEVVPKQAIRVFRGDVLPVFGRQSSLFRPPSEFV